MKIKKSKNMQISPYILIILSFLITILFGTLLLSLPFSKNDGVEVSFIDTLFISTSASCVTGLSTLTSIVDTYSVFGKVVLVILMEIGGLSIITLASFVLMLFGRKMGFSSKLFLTSALNQNTPRGILSLLKKIVIVSFSIQTVFIIINTFILYKYYGDFFETLGVAIFHTASSFNNAGFDIFGSSSMIEYHSDVLLSLSTILAITLGGLGFIVLAELISLPFNKHLSFHSKAVLLISSILIFIPMIVFKFSMNISWLEALFTSVTARTAGFTVIDFSVYMRENIAYPLMLILMFVGASPVSTGGGVKTTTFFTIIVTIIYSSVGKKPRAFKRSIGSEAILKSFTLVFISLAYILLLSIGLKAFNSDLTYQDLFFEAFSAFATVGVSMGITPLLSIGSKILICITMFIGRVGPLSFVSIWNNSFMEEKSANVKYVEEKIIIG